MLCHKKISATLSPSSSSCNIAGKTPWNVLPLILPVMQPETTLSPGIIAPPLLVVPPTITILLTKPPKQSSICCTGIIHLNKSKMTEVLHLLVKYGCCNHPDSVYEVKWLGGSIHITSSTKVALVKMYLSKIQSTQVGVHYVIAYLLTEEQSLRQRCQREGRSSNGWSVLS